MLTGRRRLASAIVLAIAFSLAISSPALAKKRSEKVATYVVPFTCGPNEESAGGVVAGEYATAITVSNASTSAIMARASIVVTSPKPARSDRVRRVLRAGGSFLIDCDTLLSAFMLPEPKEIESFFQGVLTIDSRNALDVVVQTSATGSVGGISVQSRQVRGSVTQQRRTDVKREVEICHIPPGNPDNRHTLLIDESDVAAHIGHGDHLGDCDADDDE